MLNKLLGSLAARLPESNRYERIWKLAQVDFKKRYFNTELGLLWALINPLFRLFVYFFVFTWLGRMKSENFGLYIFSALIIWMAFSEATSKGIAMLNQKKYLLENIKFNKVDLFLSSSIAVFLGLVFNISAYIGVSLLKGIPIYPQIVWIPLLLINLFILCAGMSMILATLNIYFKDIKHLWAICIMLGFWTMPAIFPLENFTGNLEYLLFINPTAGILINFRNALLYGNPIDCIFLGYCLLYSSFIYFIGRFLLKRYWQDGMERR